ncbi:MAG TPA: radical SAM protein [Deltaproteobacteria bacterium]|nr:radical SAM protein [Deltaproteobacteria bacterium]
MTDLLILVPGIRTLPHRERFTTIYDFPRGALSLASFLNARGVETAVVPLDYYMGEAAHGEGPEAVEARLRSVVDEAMAEFRPSHVGVSCAYTMLYPVSLRIIERCKAADPSITAGLGGPHVSYLDERCFADSEAVDWVVRGEGEWTLLEILSRFREGRDLDGVAGVSFRADGGAVVRERLRPPGEIGELAQLDYGLLPEGFVRSMGVSIVGSRGCAYRCTYCNESVFWGRKVRRMPVERIIAELEVLARRYGNYAVGLEDSMFNMKTRYFFELMEGIEGMRLNPGFYLLSRVDSVTPEGFKAMRRAGVNNLVLGVESASPRVLRAMGKGTTPEQAEAAMRQARRFGLTVGTFWIFGHPGDTPGEAAVSLEAIDRFYASDLMQNSEIALFVPYPGTDIFDRPEDYGVEILDWDWERWGRFNTEPVCQLRDFSRDEILAAWRAGAAIAEKWMLRRRMAAAGGLPVPSAAALQPQPDYRGVGRNSPCPCGSGRKFKRCCGA